MDAKLIARRRGEGAVVEFERVLIAAGIVGIDGLGNQRGGKDAVEVQGVDRVASLGSLTGLDVALGRRVIRPGGRVAEEGQRGGSTPSGRAKANPLLTSLPLRRSASARQMR